MKETNKDALERLFHDGLNSLRHEPDPEVWSAIRSRVKPSRKIGAFWIWSGTAMVGVLALGIGIRSLINDPVSDTPAQKATQQTITQRNGNTGNPSANPADIKPEQPAESWSPADHIPNVANPHFAEPPAEALPVTLPSSIASPSTPAVYPSENPQRIASRSPETFVPGTPALALSGLPFSINTNLLQPRPEDIPATDKYRPSPWSLSTGFGASQALLSNTSILMPNGSFTRNIANRNWGSWTSFNIQYAFGTNSYLRAGLEEYRYGLDVQQHYAGLINTVEYIDADRKTGFVRTYDSVGQFSHHNYRMVTVPLEYGMNIPTCKNWNIDWSVGLNIGRIYRQDAVLALGSYYSQETLNKGSNWITQTRISLGLSYRFHPQMQVYGRYALGYSLNPVYRNELFHERHHIQGMQFGIRFQLSKQN